MARSLEQHKHERNARYGHAWIDLFTPLEFRPEFLERLCVWGLPDRKQAHRRLDAILGLVRSDHVWVRFHLDVSNASFHTRSFNRLSHARMG